MKWTVAASLGLVAGAAAKKPDASAPGGCKPSHDGKFQVGIYSAGSPGKRDLEKRECGGEGTLVMSLKDGVVKDAKDRIGYIASNYQFQFDAPVQDGTIYDSGFSLCSNNSLALGGSTIFYRCLSGTFYNLYDRHWAEQCSPIELVAMSCSGGSGGSGSGGSGGGNGGGKPVGTSMVQTTVISVISDGQPQVHTTMVPIPMCQIGDGQVQAHTTPCASVPPVSQISDGQPQGGTQAPAPVAQISDGQIQAPSKPPVAPPVVSQISDGQPQAPSKTPPVVSQISDGQPQAPSKAPPVVSQISDGQPQAPTGPVVSQISDGQPQAPTGNATAPPAVPTAAAGKVFPGVAAAVVAFAGAVMYL